MPSKMTRSVVPALARRQDAQEQARLARQAMPIGGAAGVNVCPRCGSGRVQNKGRGIWKWVFPIMIPVMKTTRKCRDCGLKWKV